MLSGLSLGLKNSLQILIVLLKDLLKMDLLLGLCKDGLTGLSSTLADDAAS